MNKNYAFNALPLRQNPFAELKLGEIRPKGWLLKQLELQAKGKTGMLEDIWNDVGPDSGWLGGKGEDWERGPYYCDGLIPLAYLLDDADLIDKAKRWVDWTLASQDDSGMFGPRSNDDWWPRMVMLKGLAQYYDAVEDERVLEFMIKYFRHKAKSIDQRPLSQWGKIRGGELLLTIYWLYNRKTERFLLELAHKVFEQTVDWTSFLANFPYPLSMKHYLKEMVGAEDAREVPLEEMMEKIPAYDLTHGVNFAMGVKQPAVYFQQAAEEDMKQAVYHGIEAVTQHHGTANGMFTCDEHLGGSDPVQGTELCAVVEYMFSLEQLVRIFGDACLAEQLEKIAYNALPAMLTPDLRGHQYLQQANQVLCSLAKRSWYNNGEESNVFGLEPNFGCCTANLHQGWPKFIRHLWMATNDGGLAAVAYAPCEVNAKVAHGVDVRLEVDTLYPFNEEIAIHVNLQQSTEFPLHIRIPSWCEEPRIEINGQVILAKEEDHGKYRVIRRLWNDGESVRLRFPMPIRLSRTPGGEFSVERGPLVYALQIEEEWRKLGGDERCPDLEVHPLSDWNYALIVDENEKMASFKVMESTFHEEQPFQWNRSSLKIIAEAKKVDQWTLVENSAGKVPSEVENDGMKEQITLIPYGCAHLRISHFPVIIA